MCRDTLTRKREVRNHVTVQKCIFVVSEVQHWEANMSSVKFSNFGSN